MKFHPNLAKIHPPTLGFGCRPGLGFRCRPRRADCRNLLRRADCRPRCSDCDPASRALNLRRQRSSLLLQQSAPFPLFDAFAFAFAALSIRKSQKIRVSKLDDLRSFELPSRKLGYNLGGRSNCKNLTNKNQSRR